MPTKQLERIEQRVRPFSVADFAVRAAADDESFPTFTGHAAVFNSRTAIGNPLTWGFYEEVATGAFTKTLQEGDARFLIDHDTSLLVARVSADDLRLAEDDIGLAVDSDLDTELSYVRDLVRNLERRRLTGMSFGFRVIKDDWNTERVPVDLDGEETEIEIEVRVIREVELFEVSAVTFPAYDDTDAAVRAVQFRSDPDPFGRRSTILRPEPGETTRDHTSQPAETTGAPEHGRPSLLALRSAEKWRDAEQRLADLAP